MTTRLFVLILILFAQPAFSTAATHKSGQEISLLKTVFIYNFAKFTRWPESQPEKNQDSITFCSVGNDSITSGLQMLNGKKLKGRTIKVIHLNTDTTNIKSCNVIYLSKSSELKTEYILQEISDTPCLTISEMPDFLKYGGMIELQSYKDKVRFSINLATTRAAGLEISARLLNLATIVEETALP